MKYANKEVMRDIAQPDKGSQAKMKRIARYLKGIPRMTWHYPLQSKQEYMDVPVDFDWAPDHGDRKSISAGAIMIG